MSQMTWKVWVEDQNEQADPERRRATIEAKDARGAVAAYVQRESLTVRPIAICVQLEPVGLIETLRLGPGELIQE